MNGRSKLEVGLIREQRRWIWTPRRKWVYTSYMKLKISPDRKYLLLSKRDDKTNEWALHKTYALDRVDNAMADMDEAVKMNIREMLDNQ
jgi:hypothetical protein